MSAPITEIRIAADTLAAFHARMRTTAALLVVPTTLAAVIGPMLSLYLGFLIPIAIAAWVIGVPMWRRATHRMGEARLVTFEGTCVTEALESKATLVVSQPIVAARAFDTHLELVVGTLTPKISLTEISVPWTPSEKAGLVSRLASEHGIHVIQRGSHGRLLLWAFTVVPIGALALMVATRTVGLILAGGVLFALSHLDARQWMPALVVLLLASFVFIGRRALAR